MVLLNCSQNQELLDEGTAREVVNRIQKLRKKAGLVPTDDVLVYYDVAPPESELNQVLKSYGDYIRNVIKKPFHAFPVPAETTAIVGESQSLKGVTESMLHLSIYGGPEYVNRMKNLFE